MWVPLQGVIFSAAFRAVRFCGVLAYLWVSSGWRRAASINVSLPLLAESLCERERDLSTTVFGYPTVSCLLTYLFTVWVLLQSAVSVTAAV